MGDRNHRAHERAPSPSAKDDITVAFHKVDGHGASDEPDERTAERIHLRGNCRVSCHYEEEDDGGGEDDEDEEEEEGSGGDAEGARRGEEPPEGSGWKRTLCPPACCVRGEPASREESAREGPEKPKKCSGIGLFYALLSTVFFSVIALLVKTIQGIHAIEISAIRCFFQMLFIIPFLIYNKTGFLGPRDKRVYLVFRGFIGSNAMIMLFYAVQQMPLADATVIMFSNPVFTSLLAWLFLKEKCTIWDGVFTIFTLTGVILIARPPFLFGAQVHGIEGNYANHIKGSIAALSGAIGAALTYVVLRKIGKSVHYCLSVWYYAVIGFIQSIIAISVLGEWKIPFCGRDRWILVLIAALGIAGQAFLTKALQIERAGPVALMRTVDVLLAFIFQFIFFNRAPTWWSLGGALCVVASTTGVAFRKWYSSSRKS